jgi:hypothetical protein
MNEKSKTEKTAFGLTEKKFYKMMEEQERLSKEPFEDKTLEQFVKEPKKSNLYDEVKSTTNFILLFFLFCVICAVSVISSLKGAMEVYVAVPNALLSMIGIVILVKDAKKNDEENNKKYK